MLSRQFCISNYRRMTNGLAKIRHCDARRPLMRNYEFRVQGYSLVGILEFPTDNESLYFLSGFLLDLDPTLNRCFYFWQVIILIQLYRCIDDEGVMKGPFAFLFIFI